MVSKYNENQVKAITADLNHNVVIAGAGTGKTSVLIERIVYLINEKKINPSRIWVITFTNKAIAEIKERISHKNIPIPDWIGTFHSSFLVMLRKHIGFLNHKNDFRVIDKSDQSLLIRRVVRNHQITETPAKILDFFSKFKSLVFPKIEFDQKVYDDLADDLFFNVDYDKFLNFYREYHHVMKQENMLDFDDLMLYAKELMKHNEALLHWQNAFDAILIDEFQDINELQFHVVRKILGEKKNIFCVGDPDQSIYGFRGSDPKIFNKFIKIYPETNIIKLEQNYRSTKRILKIANLLINKNPNLFSKNLFTNNESGEYVNYFHARTEKLEIDWVISKIKKLVDYEGAKYRDCIILYRNNYLSKAFETALLSASINYVVFGDIKFYDRIEIKLVLNYLNFIFFKDSFSLEKIINFPNRKIGDITVKTLKNFAENQKITLYEAVFERLNESGLTTLKQQPIISFCALMKEFFDSPKNNIASLIQEIIEKTGYKKQLIEKKEKARYNNIIALSDQLSKKVQDNPSKDLKTIISEISLYISDNVKSDNVDRLNLSTVHNVKGLEYKYVFVVKMTEKIFPSIQSINKNEIEDERRLAYVAFTRAKKQLFISSSPQMSFAYSNSFMSDPSRFISEIRFNGELDIEKNFKGLK